MENIKNYSLTKSILIQNLLKTLVFSLKFDNKKFPVHSANLTVSSSVKRMEHFVEGNVQFHTIVKDEWQYNNYNSREGFGPQQCSSRSQNIITF